LKIGLDTNVLVYAHLAGSPQHEAVRRFLRRRLESRSVTLVISPLVLHEFVHVVTDPRRFDPPVAMSEAIALSRRYLGRSNVECLAVDEGAMVLALELLDREGLGRKRVADALLAATLLSHGVERLASCNSRDFEIFEGLEIIDPSLE